MPDHPPLTITGNAYTKDDYDKEDPTARIDLVVKSSYLAEPGETVIDEVESIGEPIDDPRPVNRR